MVNSILLFLLRLRHLSWQPDFGKCLQWSPELPTPTMSPATHQTTTWTGGSTFRYSNFIHLLSPCRKRQNMDMAKHSTSESSLKPPTSPVIVKITNWGTQTTSDVAGFCTAPGDSQIEEASRWITTIRAIYDGTGKPRHVKLAIDFLRFPRPRSRYLLRWHIIIL